MADKRVLIATDVPFWRSSTGAQQRVLHLVLALSRGVGGQSFEVATFYIGEKFDQLDGELVDELGLTVSHHQSKDPPCGASRRIRGHLDGTLHFVRQAFRDKPRSKEAFRPVVLEDFRWPWAIQAFGESVKQFEHDVIICEYIKMAYLLEALSAEQRDQITCAVDTHDILNERMKQFVQFGYDHWLNIEHDEESKVLSLFDAIMAIVETESHELRRMAPNAKVITVGHSVSRLTQQASPGRQTDAQSALSIGYLGSGNASNGHALTKFIRTAWPPLCDALPNVKLVVAGSICDWLLFQEESLLDGDDPVALRMELTADPRVEILGCVKDPSDFYSRVDLSLNPVEFGTGLKIKCCESLAYGVPSVITAHALDAVPDEAAAALVVATTVKSMADVIAALGNDRQRLDMLREDCLRVTEQIFNDEHAYGEFAQWLGTNSSKAG